jgi:hypothetical protein
MLLLHNFELLNNFNIIELSPLLLVMLGAWILLRGDLRTDDARKTFGITRGSVESAALDIHAGEIDVHIDMLPTSNQERLIAYRSYPSPSRPQLKVDGVHTSLTMKRADTPWFSLVDWDMLLAQGLPWQIGVTSHLGKISLNLAEGIVSAVKVATGIGNIDLITPAEALDTLQITSVLGTVHIITPKDNTAHITINAGRFVNVHVDDTRYTQFDDAYIALDTHAKAPQVNITVNNTFGDIYLS